MDELSAWLYNTVKQIRKELIKYREKEKFANGSFSLCGKGGGKIMSHEIMNVKLCELDDCIARLHSRIRLTEITDAATLKQEIAAAERQCLETSMTLRQKLAHSRGAVARELSGTYEKTEGQLKLMNSRLQALVQRSDDPEEEETLLAEYALDFALLAADRALLLSMQAICAHQNRETEERKSS